MTEKFGANFEYSNKGTKNRVDALFPWDELVTDSWPFRDYSPQYDSCRV